MGCSAPMLFREPLERYLSDIWSQVVVIGTGGIGCSASVIYEFKLWAFMSTDEALCNHISCSPCKIKVIFPTPSSKSTPHSSAAGDIGTFIKFTPGSPPGEQTQTPSLMVIVAEGMPPIQIKLREDVPRGVCRSLKIIRGLRPSTR